MGSTRSRSSEPSNFGLWKAQTRPKKTGKDSTLDQVMRCAPLPTQHWTRGQKQEIKKVDRVPGFAKRWSTHAGFWALPSNATLENQRQVSWLELWLRGAPVEEQFCLIGSQTWSQETQFGSGTKVLLRLEENFETKKLSSHKYWTDLSNSLTNRHTRIFTHWMRLDDEGVLDRQEVVGDENAGLRLRSLLEHWALVCSPVEFWKKLRAKLNAIEDPQSREAFAVLWESYASRARAILMAFASSPEHQKEVWDLAGKRLCQVARSQLGLTGAEWEGWTARFESQSMLWVASFGPAWALWPHQSDSDARREKHRVFLCSSENYWQQLWERSVNASDRSGADWDQLMHNLSSSRAPDWMRVIDPDGERLQNREAEKLHYVINQWKGSERDRDELPNLCDHADFFRKVIVSERSSQGLATLQEIERIHGAHAWGEYPVGTLHSALQNWIVHRSQDRQRPQKGGFYDWKEGAPVFVEQQWEIGHFLIRGACEDLRLERSELLSTFAFLCGLGEDWARSAFELLPLPVEQWATLEWSMERTLDHVTGISWRSQPCGQMPNMNISELLLLCGCVDLAKSGMQKGMPPVRVKMIELIEIWAEKSQESDALTRIAARMRSQFEHLEFEKDLALNKARRDQAQSLAQSPESSSTGLRRQRRL